MCDDAFFEQQQAQLERYYRREQYNASLKALDAMRAVYLAPGPVSDEAKIELAKAAGSLQHYVSVAEITDPSIKQQEIPL